MQVIRDLRLHDPSDKKYNEAIRKYFEKRVESIFGTKNHQEIFRFLHASKL